MNARNYIAEMLKIIDGFGGEKPRLLLHACCAPCSSSCLERLKDFFSITVFFYNPNIDGEEYFKRKDELIRLITETGWAQITDCDHDAEKFYNEVKGLENCAEGGARCARCFELRLEETAKTAAAGNFDFFATTLTISPLKNAPLINSIGERLAEKYGARWLPCDFKKADGYLRSLELSKQYGLYRQNYCGCIFSKPNA
ncbi:MAG: epoxyqueuosine reductase QueH [Clostridia bacterium]|nr:epoxyqueuosine reductase QueH [Clostridia bacterium]